MDGHPAIRQWPAAYYDGDKRRWIYGQLMVTYRDVRFFVIPDSKPKTSTQATQQAAKHVLSIKLEDITRLKKATSVFIYSALVVCVQKSDYWFSSLPNRDVVYNIIEYLWRNQLIPEKATHQQSSKGSTKMGQELLRITKDSENTLQRSGVQMKRQGEQLDYTSSMMFDIHEDLTVVENVVSGLESWLGRWRMPDGQVAQEPMEVIDGRGIPMVYEFSILYFNSVDFSETKRSSIRKGFLRLSKDGITILDDGMLTVHHYNPRDVSTIQVMSPWELIISRFMIGQPDISYKVMATSLVKILKTLEPIYGGKLQYDDPPEFAQEPCTPKSRTSSLPTTQSGKVQGASSSSLTGVSELVISQQKPSWSDEAAAGQSSVGAGQGQLQNNQSQAALSEEEAEELGEMMARMKSMALDIQNEQDYQVDKIDKLTSNVDRANMRIESNTRRIKRLL